MQKGIHLSSEHQTTDCQSATPATSAANWLPTNDIGCHATVCANPQAPEQPKKTGQKRVGEKAELQPLVGVYYDALEDFDSPVL